jgi:RNA polymerase sigma-70 factor (ECF subfamily)
LDPTRIIVEGTLTRVIREEVGRLTAILVRLLGDFDLAEDMVHDAVLAALERWPRDGVPSDPAAWLMTTARHRAIDHWRREERYQRKLALLVRTSPPPEAVDEVDDRLRLIFTCCHPALPREGQVALTLRTVIGLTTPEIARAFLASEAAISQSIVRAKRKIVEAGIPFRMPASNRQAERLHEVLTVVYLMLNEAYLTTGGEAVARRDLVDDAEWLASLVVRLLPNEPEALGLLALIRLHRARWAARFVALSHVAGPERALSEVEELDPALGRYHLYHATRADLLRRLGRPDEAREADARALELTTNRAERLLLEERLS